MGTFSADSRVTKSVAAALAAGALGATVAGTAGAATTHAPTADGPASAHAARGAPLAAAATVPADLKRAEAVAEDVIGFLEQGQKTRSTAQAQTLARLAHGPVAGDLLRAGVAPAKVKMLQARADRVAALARSGASDLSVSLAANKVSAMMTAFYSRYSDPLPASVLKLDYLDRQVQLQSQARNRTQTKTAIPQLAATWKSLRPQVIRHPGGARVAKQYDAHLGDARQRPPDKHRGRSSRDSRYRGWGRWSVQRRLPGGWERDPHVRAAAVVAVNDLRATAVCRGDRLHDR